MLPIERSKRANTIGAAGPATVASAGPDDPEAVEIEPLGAALDDGVSAFVQPTSPIIPTHANAKERRIVTPLELGSRTGKDPRSCTPSGHRGCDRAKAPPQSKSSANLAIGLPQHPDQVRPERPVLLTVDQQLGRTLGIRVPKTRSFTLPDTFYAATSSSWLVQSGQRVASKAMSVLQYGHGLVVASLGPAIRLYALMTMNITNATMRKETRAFRNLP